MDANANVSSPDTALKTKKPGLSTGTLKLIACISMIIDHFAASVLEQRVFGHGSISIMDRLGEYGKAISYSVVGSLRLIGRPAFLIYAFFIAFGFTKTRNKWKYLGRLVILALISEVPFDMMLFGEFFNFNYQNVFFTLSIGLGVIWGMSIFLNKVKKLKTDLTKTKNASDLAETTDAKNIPTKSVNGGKFKIFLNFVMAFLVYFTGCVLAFGLSTDYGIMGVTLIVSIYLFLENRKVLCLCLSFLSVVAEAVIKFTLSIIKLAIHGRLAYMLLEHLGINVAISFGNLIIMLGIFWIIYAIFHKICIRNMEKSGKPAYYANYFFGSLYGFSYLTALNVFEISAVAGSVLMYFFNGERGWNNKWFFYLFYPVHLLIFGIIMVLTK